jgi:hypothetical protein
MIIPTIISLETLVRFESQIEKMVTNNGTRAAMMAASPLLIYSSDHVRNPLAKHSRNIPWIEIFFNTSLFGSE